MQSINKALITILGGGLNREGSIVTYEDAKGNCQCSFLASCDISGTIKRQARRFCPSSDAHMIRWIAFDDETAEAIVSRFKRGAAEIQQGDPLDTVLRYDRPSILILPSETPGKVLFARFESRVSAGGQISSEEPIGYEATGFLGLIDEPVFTRRQPQPTMKRKWWQRLSA
jgi:hypothetical protein